jgi:hypothetical protein
MDSKLSCSWGKGCPVILSTEDLIMATPILTQVDWSKGRYDSYVLHPDGLLIATIHPPGFAWQVYNNEHNASVPNHMMFLSSRSHVCRGRWHIAALLPCPYRKLSTGKSYHCQLILVMGVKCTAKTLFNRQVHVYYYKMRGDLGDPFTITELLKSTSQNPHHFVMNAFESFISMGSEKEIQIRYLNQISGPTLSS